MEPGEGDDILEHSHRVIDRVETFLRSSTADLPARRRAVEELEEAVADLVEFIVTEPESMQATRAWNLLQTTCRLATAYGRKVSADSNPHPRNVVDAWLMRRALEGIAPPLGDKDRVLLAEALTTLRPFDDSRVRELLRSLGVPPKEIEPLLVRLGMKA